MTVRQKKLSVLLALLAGGVVASGWFWPEKRIASGWLVTLALVTAFILTAGKYQTNLWRGVLIDSRQKISLSRLQLGLWTILVLTAVFSVAFHNLRYGRAGEALDFTIPKQLLILLGISATSLVGSPLIKGMKMKKESTAAPVALMASKHVQGVVVMNNDPKDASWGDLLGGEDVGNYQTLDLGKVQMFLFTLIIVLVYAFALAESFAQARGPIRSLPEVSGGMNMLLGISHSAYLVNKALPR